MRLACAFAVLAVCAGCDCRGRVVNTNATLVAEPELLDFGTLMPGATAMRSLVVRNTGTGPAEVSALTIEGMDATRFALMSPNPGTIGEGEEATVWITFTAPSQPVQLARASLVVSSDAVNTRLPVPLLGATSGTFVECGTCDGGTDAGTDAGSPDAGVDAGVPDAGAPDAGPPDAGPPDAGPPDAGLLPDGGCQARNCTQAGATCGTISDGCGGQLTCGACTMPELCGGGGTPNVCGVPPGSCPSVAAPMLTGPSSTCALRMPPTAGIPCDIPTPGTQFYVNAATGNDNNNGTSPATPWQTLCKALASATSGSTVRVAAGTYLTADINIARPLTFKGGYDSTFTTWDPDVYHSIIAGKVNLADDGAVLGGFRLITRTNAQGPYRVSGGTLVRNYIEMQLEATPLGSISGFWHTSYGVIAAASVGNHVTIACNDIYARNIPHPMQSLRLLSAVELGNVAVHSGDTTVTSNRVCLDAYSGSYASSVIGGYGSCIAGTPAYVTITNNVLEGRTSGTTGIDFYACNDDLFLTATNNTVLVTDTAVSGYDGTGPGGRGVPIHWRLTNNVFSRLGTTGGSAFSISGPLSDILSLEGNVAFGFNTNAPALTPAVQASNDFTGAHSLATTFIDAPNGDYRPLAGGPAVSGGVNVYGQATYGNVTHDLIQRARPDAGAWGRGALLP